MPVYPGAYKAKAVAYNAPVLTVFVPQVFGDQAIEITEFVGGPTQGMGWVVFQGGSPDHPLWLSSGGGGGSGTVTDTMWVGPDPPPSPDIELWWDTDEVLPDDALLQIKGVLTGAGTALPGSPTNGDVWITADPVPTAIPDREIGGDAVAGDVITWNGTEWLNIGPLGVPGPPGPAGPPSVDIWVGTQAEFDALASLDPTTFYYVTP
jgi:hypothetical protein